MKKILMTIAIAIFATWAQAGTVTITQGSGGGNLNITGPGDTGWTKSGTNVYTSTSSNNVGIGTSAPGKTIDVTGTGRVTSSLSVGDTTSSSNKFEVYAVPSYIYGSNFLTGGSITYNNQYNGTSYAAANAFDGNTGTAWGITSAGDIPSWIIMDLGAGVTKTAKKVGIYTITTYSPDGFIVSGSNNGSSWTTLYTGSMTSTTGWQYFTFNNSTGYRYYRLYNTSGWTSDSANVYEFQAYESTGVASNASAFYVDTNGYSIFSSNVGINVASPQGVLDVAGNTYNETVTTGYGLCYTSGHQLGHCTTVLNSSGACTCTAN